MRFALLCVNSQDQQDVIKNPKKKSQILDNYKFELDIEHLLLLNALDIDNLDVNK